MGDTVAEGVPDLRFRAARSRVVGLQASLTLQLRALNVLFLCSLPDLLFPLYGTPIWFGKFEALRGAWTCAITPFWNIVVLFPCVLCTRTSNVREELDSRIMTIQHRYYPWVTTQYLLVNFTEAYALQSLYVSYSFPIFDWEDQKLRSVLSPS